MTLFCEDSNDEYLEFYKKLSCIESFWDHFFERIRLIDFHFINAYALSVALLSIKRYRKQFGNICYNKTLSKNFIKTVREYHNWKQREGDADQTSAGASFPRVTRSATRTISVCSETTNHSSANAGPASWFPPFRRSCKGRNDCRLKSQFKVFRSAVNSKDVVPKFSFLREFGPETELIEESLIEEHHQKFIFPGWSGRIRESKKACLSLKLKLENDEIFILLVKLDRGIIRLEAFRIVPYYKRISEKINREILRARSNCYEQEHRNRKQAYVQLLTNVTDELYLKLAHLVFEKVKSSVHDLGELAKQGARQQTRQAQVDSIQSSLLSFLHFMKYFYVTERNTFSKMKNK